MASTLRRRDVILSLLAAFIAWAWATHWLPSLRLVPYVFIIGIAVGVVIILYALHHGSRREQHAFSPLHASSSALAFTSPQAWTAEASALGQRQLHLIPPIQGVVPPLTGSLDLVVHLVLRDYVGSWYSKISEGSTFANEIDRAVRSSLGVVFEHVLAIDLPYFFITRVLPIINEHLDRFIEAEEAVHGKELSKKNITDTEELDVAIAARFNNGRLHVAASLAASRSAGPPQQHLRKLVEKLLPLVLPENMKGSSVVTVLVREIVACAVLTPFMAVILDPDFINQQIEAYGHAVLQERKTVKKLRAALDEHASPRIKAVKGTAFPYLLPTDSERIFKEGFLGAIKQLKPLSNAMSVRDEVRRRLEQEHRSSSRETTYARRLGIGKRLLDQRVEQLLSRGSTNGNSDRRKAPISISRNGLTGRNITLKDTLSDPSGLAHFMEFMDRSGLTAFVQFWVVVDGFRTLSEKSSNECIGNPHTDWTEAERQHVANVRERYIWRPEIRVPVQDQRTIKGFLDSGRQASIAQYSAARRTVLMAQARVFREMEMDHFPAFTQSDLYARCVSAMSGVTTSPTSASGDQDRAGESARPTSSLTTGFRSRTTTPVAGALKSPDLRRAIASSSELSANFKKSDLDAEPRRSLDEDSPRRPLFEDDVENDFLTNSIGSLDSETESVKGDSNDQANAVDAVQAALDSIVDEDAEHSTLLRRPSPQKLDIRGTPPSPRDIPWPGDRQEGPSSDRPNLQSLGLLGTPSKRTVFNSDDLFGDSEKLWEDDATDVSADEKGTDEDDIKEAAPGHLGLAEVIQSLSLEIDKLEAQQSIINSLLSKAELTNDTAELRILRKSQTSLTREIRRKELQKQQYIVQENDNTLYGRALIAIKSVMLGTEPDGHEFALYAIEVSRPGSGTPPSTGSEGRDHIPAASWVVTRRYNEFYTLHKRLQRRFPFVRDIDFPRRKMVLTLQKEHIKKRRATLERYLRELLKNPAICLSLELRAFLSQQAIPRPSLDADNESAAGLIDRRDFVTRIYNSLTDGMEEFLGNNPVLDQLSVAGQNLISAATTASSANGSPTTASTPTIANGNLPAASYIPPAIVNDPATVAEAQRELSALDNEDNASTSSTTPFTSPKPASTSNPTKVPIPVPFVTPLATTFLTLFRLRSSSANPVSTASTPSTTSYLRGRAVVIILQALLGGTVERRVRDSFATFTTPSSLASYLDMLTDIIWPPQPSSSTNKGQKERSPNTLGQRRERTKAEKERSRAETDAVLRAVLAERAGGVVGRTTAGEAGARLGRLIRNERIIRSLGFSILDEVMEGVFGVVV